MTFSGDLCYVENSKLFCEANRWTSSCMMRFLPKVRSKQTMILHLCGSEKYTTVLCFSIRVVMLGSLHHLALRVWSVSWSGL